MTKQSIVLLFMMLCVLMAMLLRARYGIRDRLYDAALLLAALMLFGFAAHIAGGH
jgi:hypothetical protein